MLLVLLPVPKSYSYKQISHSQQHEGGGQGSKEMVEFVRAEQVTGVKVQSGIQADVRHGDGQAVEAEGSKNQTKVHKNNTGEQCWSNYTVMTMMWLRRETDLESSGDGEENHTQVQDIRVEHVITQAGNLTGSR